MAPASPVRRALFADPELQQIPHWQDTIVRAFQTWAQYTGTNIKVVSDRGLPFGTSGATYSDPRFGDVRVAAVPLSSDVIAMAVPQGEVVSGTWAGDLLFNLDAPIARAEDLFSVALHEAGHVFGLGHSNDPASPMFFHGVSQAVTPTALDIQALRAASGLATIHESADNRDHHEDGEGEDEGEGEGEGEGEDHELAESSGLRNQPFVREARLVAPVSPRSTRYATAGVLRSNADVNYARIAPSGADNEDLDVLTVTVRTTDAGSFIPEVEVLSSAGQVLKADVLANGNGTLVLQVNDADPRESYVVRVSSADQASGFHFGRYALETQFTRRESKLDELVADTLTNESPSLARGLHVSETTLAHFALTVVGVAGVPTATVWAVLYDAAGNVVQHIAAHPGDTRSSSAVLLAPGDYRVEFHAADPSGQNLPALAFDFRGKPISLPIGPGISDPTLSPVLPVTGNPQLPKVSRPPDLIVTAPVIFPTPGAIKVPAQPIVVRPPSLDPSRWYWDTVVIVTPR